MQYAACARRMTASSGLVRNLSSAYSRYGSGTGDWEGANTAYPRLATLPNGMVSRDGLSARVDRGRLRGLVFNP
jgi:hypothetical protein